MMNDCLPGLAKLSKHIHPLGPYPVQSAGAAEAIGHNPGQVTTLTQDTQMAQSSQQAGTHFADLRWMTD